jgi:pyridoxine kinase
MRDDTEIAVPRLAEVHDLTGSGRTSLTPVVPILSTMGVRVCPIPPAVLSTYTGGFSDYRFKDLTAFMGVCTLHGNRPGFVFDAVSSRFPGSSKQTDLVADFIATRPNGDQFVAIEPVTGDSGATCGPIAGEMVA